MNTEQEKITAKIARAGAFRHKKNKGLKVYVLQYLLEKAFSDGMQGAFDAISAAYDLGYYDGHAKAIRERKEKTC